MVINLAILHRPTPRAVYVADLGVSSLSNFMVLLVAAHVGGRVEFGAAAVGIGLVTLAITLRQAAIGDLVVVRSASALDRSAAGHAYTVSFGWGVLATVGTVAAVHAIGGAHTGFSMVLLMAPMLCLQDAGRYLAFAKGRPGIALAADGLWVALQTVGLVGLAFVTNLTVTEATGVWVVAGSASGLWVVVRLGIAPKVRGSAAWLRSEKAFVGAATTQTLTSAGTTAALIYGVGIFASATAAGALRGIQTLFGPLNVLLVAERLRLTRHYAQAPESLNANVEGRRTRVFVVACAVAYGVALGATPRALGTLALGATWLPAHSLVLPMSLQVLFLGLMTVPAAAFTATLQLRKAVALRAALGVSTLTCSFLLLMWLPPATAVAWGLATSSAIMPCLRRVDAPVVLTSQNRSQPSAEDGALRVLRMRARRWPLHQSGQSAHRRGNSRRRGPRSA